MWKYLLLTKIRVVIYDSWEEKAWKPNQHGGCSRHWGKLPALTDVHWEQREVLGWAGAYTPHLPIDGHPQPALSSVQPFLLFLWSVFSQHFYCFSGLWQLCTAGCLLLWFLALSALSLWVLSRQRVVHSEKQLILVCLHLVLCRGVWTVPESYLIFKGSVYILLSRWTGVVDADWSVISGRGGNWKRY